MTLLTAEALGCPVPPPDLADRVMPVKELHCRSTPVWRIHRAVYGPIHYNRRSAGGQPYRFDAPHDEFGVLYASPSFGACMAEAVIRDRFHGKTLPLLLDEEELAQRCVSRLDVAGSRRLRLADLTRPHVHLGMDNRIFSTADYRGPNLWSAAIRDAFPDLDGLYFTSRFANEPSVAVFDRARLVPRGTPIPLLEFPLLADFLDAYGIGLAPGGDCWG